MSRNVPGLTLAYRASEAIEARRIARAGGVDGTVLRGSSGTDALVGVTTDIPAAEGETCDVQRSGCAPVVYGGSVSRGDPLTSDSQARAITAVAGVGAAVRVIGFAEVTGVVGDIGSVFLAPFILRGPAA